MTTLSSPVETCATDEDGATSGPCSQGFLATHMSSFTSALSQLDEVLDAARTVDKKTDELIRFALSIKARSEPCVRKHYVGSLAAGASEEEIGYVFALTMRESAGSDDCWTHGIIASLESDQSSPPEEEEITGCCG